MVARQVSIYLVYGYQHSSHGYKIKLFANRIDYGSVQFLHRMKFLHQLITSKSKHCTIRNEAMAPRGETYGKKRAAADNVEKSNN